MTHFHIREIPRDLFNESKLLKCLGQLTILIGAPPGIRWPLKVELLCAAAGFQIQQEEGSGSIYVRNFELKCGARQIHLSTPLNAQSPYPLIFEDRDVWAAGEVFTDGGKFHPMFEMYLDDLVELLGIKERSPHA